MPVVAGMFTGPGVSAPLPITKNVKMQADGQAVGCQLQIEQSADGGATWQFYVGFDDVCLAGITAANTLFTSLGDYDASNGYDDSAYTGGVLLNTFIFSRNATDQPVLPNGQPAVFIDPNPPPAGSLYGLPAGQYRLRCIQLLSGAVGYRLSGYGASDT